MKRFLAILVLSATLALPAVADEPIKLVLREHQWIPDRLEVPAGVKIQLIVKNDSDKIIEWESADLDREEVIEPGKESTIFLGPLDKGSYGFYDDRHQDSKGVLVAK